MSLEKRIEALEGRIEPLGNLEPDEAKELRRNQIRQALNDLDGLLWREGRFVEDRMAVLQEQGHSYQDAMTIAKDEMVRSKNPGLAEFLNGSYPPEIRHDPIAKREWLENYIESRKRGSRKHFGGHR